MKESEGIIVFSCFDGMSCAQLALQKAGIKVKQYFASEVDKWAIQITQKNFPDTIQLGDITKIKAAELPKIDLFVGGSPCQGFSFAGKGLNFSDPRSKLFFEFVRIKDELNPRFFLLENVRMKKEHQDIISKYMEVEPVKINSALLSAQNRVRFYWTNITGITQPQDKGLLLKDILEDQVQEKYFLSERFLSYLVSRPGNYNGGKIRFKNGESKSNTVVTSEAHLDISKNLIFSNERKSKCFTAGGNSAGLHSQMDLISVEKDNLIYQLNPSKESNGTQPYQQNRIYHEEGISPTLQAEISSGTHAVLTQQKIRRLTPVECERLQTMPDNYTEGVSDTQRYRMLGNGFTRDVIAHILSFMPEKSMKTLPAKVKAINAPAKLSIPGLDNYPGGKGGHGVYHKIINQFPLVKTYFEAFAGGGSIARWLRPAPEMIINELDPVIFDIWQASAPSNWKVMNEDALTALQGCYGWQKDKLIYLDPPYRKETRLQQVDIYGCEMTTEQHEKLLKIIVQLKCYVAISCYDNELYQTYLKGWRKIQFQAKTRGSVATETLYMNYPQPKVLHDYRFLGENNREREHTRNMTKRKLLQLQAMPETRRNAIVSAIVQAYSV